MGEHEGGTWGQSRHWGRGAARLSPPLGCFGGRGLFLAAPSGTSVLSGDLRGAARLRGGGSAVGRGSGGSDPRACLSLDPLCPCSGRRCFTLWSWGGTGLCALPGPGRGISPLGGGFLPDGPGLGSAVPAGAVGAAGAAQPLAQGQAQNKPRLPGRAGCPGQKISLLSPWHLLTAARPGGKLRHGPAA